MTLPGLNGTILMVMALAVTLLSSGACATEDGTAAAPANSPARSATQSNEGLLEPEALITQGTYHNADGDYDKAIELFNAVIEQDPTSLRAHLGRADGYRLRWSDTRSSSDYRQSMQDYDKVISKNPYSAAAFLGKALIFGEIREIESALANLNAAIEIDRQNPFLYALRGGIYLEEGEYDKAVTNFNSAIVLDGRNGSYYFGRGLAYQEIGDHRSAENDRLKANELGFSR